MTVSRPHPTPVYFFGKSFSNKSIKSKSFKNVNVFQVPLPNFCCYCKIWPKVGKNSDFEQELFR